jgi:hypothetical protein
MKFREFIIYMNKLLVKKRYLMKKTILKLLDKSMKNKVFIELRIIFRK